MGEKANMKNSTQSVRLTISRLYRQQSLVPDIDYLKLFSITGFGPILNLEVWGENTFLNLAIFF